MSQTIKNLKKQLKEIEETPIWVGKDGAPSFFLLLFILLTGIVWGLIILYIHKKIKTNRIKKKIAGG